MSARGRRLILFLILAIQIALGIGWMAVTPLWQGHETDYFNVLRFTNAHGRLPTPADYPPGQADIAQVTQPPLFYLLAAPVVTLLDSGAPLSAGQNPLPLCIAGEAANGLVRATIPTSEAGFPQRSAAAAGYGLRLLNLALGAVAVVFTFVAARVLFPARPSIALIGAALLAFEPSTIRMITLISNDTLLMTLAAINLYCAARLIRSEPVRWRWAAALFVLAALAVLTRLTGWAVLALNVLVLLALAARLIGRGLKGRAGRRQAWIAVGVVGALAAGIFAIGAFNLAATGSVFGRYSFLDERIGSVLARFDFSPVVLTTVLDRTELAFREPLSLLAPRHAVSVVYSLAVVAALGGALAALIVAVFHWLRHRPAHWLAGLLLLWAAFLTAVGLVYFRNIVDIAAYGGVTEYNTAGAFTPMRYYAPGLPPFALLIALGLLVLMDWAGGLLGKLWRPAGDSLRRIAWLPGAALAVVWAGVTLLGLVTVAQAAPQVPAYTEEQARALPGVTWLAAAGSEAGIPRILGYATAPGGQSGMTDLTLYAALDGPGVSALGRVLMDDGTNTSACEFVPGRGTLPLPVWEPGVVYALDISLPVCDEAAEMLNLAVQWQAADAGGALTGEPSPAVTLGSVIAPGGTAPGCISPLGRIAGYTLVKYTGPDTVQAGGVVLPSINWIIEAESPDFASRVYTFTHEASGQSFTCSRMDGDVSQWTRATYRYFDRCVFTFPDDAPPGVYQVSVALLNAQGLPLTASGPDGEPLADRQVPLGSFRLE